MALPAIIGLSSLGGMIGKFFEKIVDFFFSKMGRRVAIITTVIAALYIAIGILFTVIGSSLTPLMAGLPADVTSIMGSALPSNTSACLAAIASTEIACITYSLTLKALDMKTRIV